MRRNENDFAKNFVSNRGKRCAATILSGLEKIAYLHLPKDVQVQVRRLVLDNVNDLSDVAQDLVKSDVGQINDYWVEELARLHDAIRKANNGHS